MTSSQYHYDRGHLYDNNGIRLATRAANGDYIDKRGNVRARSISKDNSLPGIELLNQRPIEFGGYAQEAGRLSSSVPGRRLPSHAQERFTTGAVQYADGLPYDRSNIRPQSSTGYAATPEAPKGEGYQQCCTPYRDGSTCKTQYLEYKEAGLQYQASLSQYQKESKKHKVDSKALAVGGTADRKVYYDQEGHRAMAPFAAAANRAGLREATLRLEHTSDHYGRVPKKGHKTHIEQAANIAGLADQGSPAQRQRYHEHYAKDPSIYDLPTDRPLAELSPAERQKREKRADIEWRKQINQWECSKTELDNAVDELKERKARDREHFDEHKCMNHGPSLPNGRYEWMSFGGGYRRYWSDRHNAYIDPPRGRTDGRGRR